VVSSATLSALVGGQVVLKVESLQRTGSFKIRGALSKLDALGDEARRGVVAGSAGNHAQSLAFAARAAGVPCEIYVPVGASIAKTEAARGYGASVIVGGETVDNAVASAIARADEAGMAFVHPYDDLAVIAGQATLGLELLADVDDLARDRPVGGGGLASGVAMAIKRAGPAVRVIGVQAAVCAPYLGRPPAAGPVPTLADGIAIKRPGRITRPLVEHWLDDLVAVEEDDVAEAMMFLLERAKLLVEGGGAVGVAALSSGLVTPADDGRTAVVLSGGNVDLGVIPNLIRRHETRAGRRLLVYARIGDRPGQLAALLMIFADAGANLIEVEHVREGVELHVRETGVQAVLEVRDRPHALAVLAAARGRPRRPRSHDRLSPAFQGSLEPSCARRSAPPPVPPRRPPSPLPPPLPGTSAPNRYRIGADGRGSGGLGGDGRGRAGDGTL
jgi:threonine dehydratase